MRNLPNRRKWLKTAATLGIGLPLLGQLGCKNPMEKGKEQIKNDPIALKILILGGTSFLGPHQIKYALERGHSVTTFTRGKSEPPIYRDMFKEVESLIGDRADNLEALKNRKWDVVIDNSGHNVDWADASASLLKDTCGMYVFTSSTGVYYPYLTKGVDEDYPVLLEEPDEIPVEAEKLEYWYGVMKANSERVVRKHFGEDRSLIVRPTYMIGPADKSNRFIYWPLSLAKGGEILVPGKDEDPVQYIDVREVTQWTIRLIEKKTSGTFNAAGPATPHNMKLFIEGANQAFSTTKNFIQIPDYAFLKQNNIHDIVPWIMPEGKNYASALINNEKAVKNGLQFRSITQSLEDTYAWWNTDEASAVREKFDDTPDHIYNRQGKIIEKWRKLG